MLRATRLLSQVHVKVISIPTSTQSCRFRVPSSSGELIAVTTLASRRASFSATSLLFVPNCACFFVLLLVNIKEHRS